MNEPDFDGVGMAFLALIVGLVLLWGIGLLGIKLGWWT